MARKLGKLGEGSNTKSSKRRQAAVAEGVLLKCFLSEMSLNHSAAYLPRLCRGETEMQAEVGTELESVHGLI